MYTERDEDLAIQVALKLKEEMRYKELVLRIWEWRERGVVVVSESDARMNSSTSSRDLCLNHPPPQKAQP